MALCDNCEVPASRLLAADPIMYMYRRKDRVMPDNCSNAAEYKQSKEFMRRTEWAKSDGLRYDALDVPSNPNVIELVYYGSASDLKNRFGDNISLEEVNDPEMRT